jgi:tetratricopeptide (TPR) repeat protein
MMKFFLPLLLILMISSCGSHQAITGKSASAHSKAGWADMQKGDWDSARRHFARAVGNGNLANLPASNMAVFNYEYGRSLGVTCFYDEAETYLLKAYELDQESDGPTYMSLTELSRLLMDQQRYEEAARYFERLFNELPEKTIHEAPIGHADILGEYAVVLSKIGRYDEAIDIRNRERSIREANPEGHSMTDRTPYGSHCADKPTASG